MNATLVNFLNHGLLPFVGRSAEVDRIEAFWRSAAEAQGLRSMLLIGEAGAGKSRLVEEAGSLVARQRGLVIHTRLYPESTTALAPLIAKAIDRAAGATSLMRVEPEGTLPAVAAALRRLSRVRRTIVIVEDVHLLAKESLQEFAVLIDNVADDSLALLCSSRTSTAPACAVLERYLVEEMRIGGFDRRGLETLLTELFGRNLDRSLADPLLETTLGNVLAVRSALRGAIRRNAIAVDLATGAWGPTVERGVLMEVFAESVRTLSEGMAVHLEEDERHFAASIAPLGEIFARRTAARLVGESVIDGLVFKGILTRSTAGATLLSGTAAGGQLLAFTHTLVHNFFLESGGSDIAALVAIVADGDPLYSAMVFRRIVAAESLGAIDADTLDRAVVRSCAVAHALNKTTDWELGLLVVEAAEKILAACRGVLDPVRVDALEAETIAARLNVMSRSRGPEYETALLRLLALTEGMQNEPMRRARAKALMHRHYWAQRAQPDLFRAILEEAEALVATYPEIMHTTEYVGYLRGAVMAARAQNAMDDIRRIQARYELVIESPETPEDVRTFARTGAATFLLDLFLTEGELERRLADFEDLLSLPGVDVPSMRLHRTIAWYEAGRLDEASASLDELMPQFRDRGWRRTIAQCQVMRLCIALLRGTEPEEITPGVEALIADHPPAFLPMIATSLVSHLANAAELAGRDLYARHLRERYGADATTNNVVLEAIVALVDDLPIDLTSVDLSYIADGGDRKILAPNPENLEETVEAFRRELMVAPFRLDSIAAARLMLLLAARHDRTIPELDLAGRLDKEMRWQASASVEWLIAMKHWHLASVTLSRMEHLIEPRRRKELERRIIASTPAPAIPVPGSGDDRIRISMLGAIEIARPGLEPLRPKGARLRMLLGVLCADAMLERHLSNQEFYRLAAEERDIDRARKAVYVAIHRLRELLGPGAIVTDGETPRLDMAVVRVDLFDAAALLRDAQAASLESAWLRASTSLLATLEITRGEVPFPGLYDSYFEGAREDFEGMLRSTVVRVARGLLGEGDPETAEEVLRRAVVAMPEDEDLSDLLCEALVGLGNRAEAERVRRVRLAAEV
ncbi:MAG TPA: AAA family ATPase [Candidatus Kapabacteria bacterium]|nr:AAA family ATPase [Candidatus Kapabacteria bacterium]